MAPRESEPCRRFDRQLTDHEVVFEGRVVAVFEGAVLARRENDGRLLTLLHPQRPMVPWGVALAWSGGPAPVGTRVSLARRRLELAEPDEGRRMELTGPGINLSLAGPGDPGERAILVRQLASLELPARSRTLLSADPGKDDPALRDAGRAVRRLACALTAPGDSVPPVAHLVGLGPGSTPTGDDLLLGLTAAAHRFTPLGWIDRRRLEALCAALATLDASATTEVAREMLAHGARGVFPAPLAGMARLLGAPGQPAEAARRAAGPLVGLGASSGTDMLAGLVSLAREIGS